MPIKPMELPFPLGGINEGQAYSRQPEGTTPDARNVRPFDTIDQRLRGGQRPGLTKYVADAVNGSNTIQSIRQVTLALDPSTVIPDTTLLNETFQYDDGILHDLNSDWTDYGSQDTTSSKARLYAAWGAGSGMDVTSNIIDGGTPATGYIHTSLYKTVTLGSSYIIELDVDVDSVGTLEIVHIFLRADPVAKTALYVVIKDYGDVGNKTVTIVLYQDDGARNALSTHTQITLPNDSTFYDPHTWSLHVNGDNMRLYCDSIEIANFGTQATYSTKTRIGFGTGQGNVSINLSAFRVYTAKVPSSLRQTKLVVVSGGSIYSGDKDELRITTNGSGVLSTDAHGVVEAYQKAYFADKVFSSYRILNPATEVVSAWTPTAGQLPGGGDGTSYPVTAVSVSTKKITATGATAAFAPNDLIEWFGCTDPKNNKVYKVTADDAADGLTVQETINSDPGANYGSIRLSNVGCRYITLYRGRIVMWGLHTDPHNWFMSASGDPLDWDYSPAAISAIQAIAGNNTDAGKIGDVLNCCAPYSDDLMIMGGDHTLWVMRGDPADRGRIDNISYQTGIVGPKAFAWDDENMLYFIGAGQLWRMNAASMQPESISRNRLDVILGSINYATNEIKLAWDRDNQGLHIFAVPIDQPSTAPIHIYWDRRSDSFWRDQFPVTMGPTTAFSFDADDPDDRALLLGGWDSYIRYVDASVKNDDGTAINSYTYLSPLNPGQSIWNARISRIIAILDSGSDDVTLTAYAEDSVQAAVDSSTIRFATTLVGGRNTFIPRITGNTILFKLSDATAGKAWAMERMIAYVERVGYTRKNQL